VMKKTIWISMRQLKAHEFHCTLRYLKNSGRTWSDIYLRLGELFEESVKKWLKVGSSLFVIYLMVSTLAVNGEVALKVLQYEASVPIAYVLAVASVLVLISLQHLLTIISIMQIRTNESIRHRLSRFSANSFGFFSGQDEMALATPVMVNSFFSDRFGIFNFLQSLYLFAISISLAPLIGFLIFLVSWQIEMAFMSPRNLTEGLVAFFSLGVTLISLIIFVIFIIPIPVEKNSFGIRWGLLVRLHRPGKHPMLSRWIKEEDPRAR
jgi:hypothetical protein